MTNETCIGVGRMSDCTEVQALIAAARREERERCAKTAEDFSLTWEAVCMAGNNGGVCDEGCDGCVSAATFCAADDIAAAIRALKEITHD